MVTSMLGSRRAPDGPGATGVQRLDPLGACCFCTSQKFLDVVAAAQAACDEAPTDAEGDIEMDGASLVDADELIKNQLGAESESDEMDGARRWLSYQHEGDEVMLQNPASPAGGVRVCVTNIAV